MNSSITEPEHYELSDGELIVNVTAFDDLAEVRKALGVEWTWTDFSVGVLTDEDDTSTEWMTLRGAACLGHHG